MNEHGTQGPSEHLVCSGCRSGHIIPNCPLIKCNNCHQHGHIASACTNPTVCRVCSEAGHEAKVCPRKEELRKCRRCNEAGHKFLDCPLNKCKNCYKLGHIAAACTNTRVCKFCFKPDYAAKDCPDHPAAKKRAAREATSGALESKDAQPAELGGKAVETE